MQQKGKVRYMELEGIRTNSSIAYTDMARQTASREPRETKATADPKAAEPVKKTVAPNAAPAAGKANEAAAGQEEEQVSRKVKDAIDKVSDKMHMAKTKCEFSYHEQTKRVSIKVIDEDTEEVIREIPPEETLEMLTKMWELAGILVDEKR